MKQLVISTFLKSYHFKDDYYIEIYPETVII